MAAFKARAVVAETGKSPYAVRIETGGHVLTGDESFAAGGGGLGPAPFELLAAALAECTAMTMRWYARGQGWSVEAIEVAVEYGKKQRAGDTAPSDVFEKTITLRAPDLSDEQRTRLLNIAAQCPVQRTLENNPVITTLVGAADADSA
ncbi:OsmC family protein [Brevundimonas sp.]|jgi:putative redox protein|uniref:OsmC family protein n=1 Tax=Brevundimonas sp. TaxID=1871086 RepID=UPI0037BFCB2D